MLPISHLIHAFESETELPVEPDDVRRWIIANGFCDEVTFHYVDTDPAMFNGIYVERVGKYLRPTGVYAETLDCREVLICGRQEEPLRRLSEVKEMVHILDRPEERSAGMAEINGLINYAATHLALPHENGLISDALAEYRAIAILFPMATRNALQGPFRDGKLSGGEIADLAKLPREYVELALSDRWDAAYAMILGEDDA